MVIFMIPHKTATSRTRALGAGLGLLFCCSCATKTPRAEVMAHELPAETPINAEAGRGGHLTVMLQMDDGRELLFMVDTGAPDTFVDESLVPKLGKKKQRQSISFVGGDHAYADLYSAPKLYWGTTRLLTGRYVGALDFKTLPFRRNPSVVGILGMDCLRHYCIQLDFEAGRIRFLPPELQETNDLGIALPISFSRGYCPQLHRANFVGRAPNLLVDIGCNIDGMVNREAVDGIAVFFPERNWGGETYTNLIVAGVGRANAVGLRFLARHVVTFDFPKGTLYLKQKRLGPLAGDHSLKGSHLGDLESPMNLLLRLKAKDQLPDWAMNDQSPICLETCSNSAPKTLESVTFSVRGRSGLTMNHYETAVGANSSQWRLQRAWQTDQAGKTTAEFTVP